MGLQIESGTGNGYLARVNKHNYLQTASMVETKAAHFAEDHGKSYTWSHAYNYDAGDTILLLSNDSNERHLHIHYILIGSDTATQWTLHSPAYPTLAGTTITGVNTNRTSGQSVEAECYGDETGNTQANVLAQGFISANSTILLPVESSILLGYHDCIAVDLVTAGTMGAVTISGYYEEQGEH